MLGWWKFPVDIGMMMTASIALGIAVDGTFHFLVRYNEQVRHTKSSASASRSALLQTGNAIFQAAVIASFGMFAMVLSNFVPMARFGMMMSTLLVAALVGDLVLLPALLAIRRNGPDARPQQPEKMTVEQPYFAKGKATGIPRTDAPI